MDLNLLPVSPRCRGKLSALVYFKVKVFIGRSSVMQSDVLLMSVPKSNPAVCNVVGILLK